MTKIITMALRAASIFAIGAGLVVQFSPTPAAAATSYGETATCSVVNPNRFQCNFPALTATEALQIQYVSAQCGSTGTPFSLQEFQVFTTPNNSTSEVSYQIQITNQPSVGGVVTAGSRVELYAKAGSEPRALIDLSPAPVHPGTQCTVSLSGLKTP